jgi:hypothetical protein
MSLNTFPIAVDRRFAWTSAPAGTACVPVLKNCIAGAIEPAIVEMVVSKQPSARYESAHELAKRGLSVSPAAVRRVGHQQRTWGLQTTPEGAEGHE